MAVLNNYLIYFVLVPLKTNFSIAPILKMMLLIFILFNHVRSLNVSLLSSAVNSSVAFCLTIIKSFSESITGTRQNFTLSRLPKVQNLWG